MRKEVSVIYRVKTIRRERSISDRFLFLRIFSCGLDTPLERLRSLRFPADTSILEKSWHKPSSITDAREARSISLANSMLVRKEFFNGLPLRNDGSVNSGLIDSFDR